jgi:hypothetical protein
VIAPRRLGRCSRIDFAGLRAELETLSAFGALELDAGDPPTELSESTRRSRLAYLDGLPDFADLTVVDRDQERVRTSRPSDVVHCPSSLVLARAASPAPKPGSALPPAPLVENQPRLWSLLAQRPFETLGLVLLVALVMAAAAIAAACVLRFKGSG